MPLTGPQYLCCEWISLHCYWMRDRWVDRKHDMKWRILKNSQNVFQSNPPPFWLVIKKKPNTSGMFTPVKFSHNFFIKTTIRKLTGPHYVQKSIYNAWQIRICSESECVWQIKGRKQKIQKRVGLWKSNIQFEFIICHLMTVSRIIILQKWTAHIKLRAQESAGVRPVFSHLYEEAIRHIGSTHYYTRAVHKQSRSMCVGKKAMIWVKLHSSMAFFHKFSHNLSPYNHLASSWALVESLFYFSFAFA